MIFSRMFMFDLHSIYFPNMEVNGYRQLSGYQHASKYYLVFN